MPSAFKQFLIVLVLVLSGGDLAAEAPVVAGASNDYQASVIRPWDAPQQRIAVFERLDGAFSGDLWLTRSEDGGESWSAPVALLASAANERHASLVQTAADAFVLVYLSNATGGFRIHRATSSDGSLFAPQGALDLGWASAGEINPQLTRDPDGSLNLVYHRLGGAAYIARSQDGGASWDTLRTQISPGTAALPRLARRAADGRYLLVYQTGASPVTLWTRTSLDPAVWLSAPVMVAADGNNHDGWPLVDADGRFALFWARAVGDTFQIHSSHSIDASGWTAPLPHSDRPGLKNVQPVVLPGGVPGEAELYWGAGQVPGDGDYDIVRLGTAVFRAPQADLAVDAVAVVDPVACGAAVQASVQVANDGPDAAPATVGFLREPDGALSVAAPQGWLCAGEATVWQCDVNELGPGAQAMFDLSSETDPSDCGADVLLSAVVESTPGLDPEPANDAAELVVSVLPAPSADLRLVGEGPDAAVACGEPAPATLSLHNLGPDAASATVLDLAAGIEPAGLQVDPPAGWACAATQSGQRCEAAVLLAGAEAIFAVARVTGPDDCGTSPVLQAAAHAAEQDPAPADNQVDVPLPVWHAPPSEDAVFGNGFEPAG